MNLFMQKWFKNDSKDNVRNDSYIKKWGYFELLNSSNNNVSYDIVSPNGQNN